MALVAFLRGINVGGHRTFRPSLLASELKEHDVVNIGAAGTFVVRSPLSQKRLRLELMRRLPFEAEVMICTGEELIAAASDHPFQTRASRSGIVRFVSILGKRPRLLPAIPVCIPAKGKWLVRILRRHDRFLFGEYRREMKAITCLGKIDGVFGVPVTTRGWSTINAILKVLEEGAHMPTKTDTLQDRLSRYRQIDITVTGRTSGRAISIPVWFVFDDGKLYLLPVKGSDTQWYKNVLKNPSLRIDARGATAEFQALPITDSKQVSTVVEKFRGKYAGDVKKYYSKFDVAVVAELR